MPRMRLISEAFRQLKIDDPNTDITMYGLKTIINSGKIPVIKVGRKTLINYDALIDYFNSINDDVNCYGNIKMIS